MSRRLVSVVSMLALLASGCGGSGGSSSLPVTPIASQGGTASIKLVIPNSASVSSHVRSAKFVSPGAMGVSIAAGPHGGALTTTAFDISSSSTLCTGTTSRTCTLNVTVLTGSDDFTITLYDTAPTGGAIPTTAHVLGVSTSASIPIISGSTALIVTYVMPTIASIASGTPSLITIAADGATHTGSIVLNPTDFSNNPITAGANDPYSNPITVTIAESGGSGHAVLTLNGTPSGSSVTVTKSSQSIGVQYDGGGAPGYSAAITAAATGATPVTLNFAPMYVTSTSPYFTNGVLNFTGAGETATLQISEALGANIYNATPQTVASCPNVGSVGATTGSGTSGSVTVTSLNAAAALSAGCVLSVADSAGTALRNIAVTNTLTSGGVTIGGIAEYLTSLSFPNHIVNGGDGNVYVTATTSNASTTTGATIRTYSAAGVAGPSSNALTADPVASAIAPDKALWFVANDNNIYTWNALNPGAVGTAAVSGASNLAGIALGPDGNMWAIDNLSGNVFELSLTFANLINTYNVGGSPTLITSCGGALWIVSPSAGSSTLTQLIPGTNPVNQSIPGSNVAPSAITCDNNGNVWIAESNENEIDEYVPGTGFSQFAIGVTSFPSGIAFGSDGNIWFTEPSSNSVGIFNVTTHLFAHRSIPTPSAGASAITEGPDGRMWFTESSAGQIGASTP